MEDTMEINKVFTNIFNAISYEKKSNDYRKTFPKEFFKPSNNNARVRISYMDKEFKKLLEEVDVEVVTKGTLVKGTLKKKTCPIEILTSDEPNPVFLSEIYFKLERQGNGEKGDLFIRRFSSRTNLFLFKNKKGYKFLIYIAWDRKHKGWSIIAKK